MARSMPAREQALRGRPTPLRVPETHFVTGHRNVPPAAGASRAAYQEALTKAGHGKITTEITDLPEFYYAEDYHQQYLAKNPGGYCPDHSCGVPYK